jgi:hypothetical protein
VSSAHYSIAAEIVVQTSSLPQAGSLHHRNAVSAAMDYALATKT